MSTKTKRIEKDDSDSPHYLGALHMVTTGHQVVFGSAYGERAECLKCRKIWSAKRRREE